MQMTSTKYLNFARLLKNYKKVILADPGGRAVYGIGLQPLNCWSPGIEFRQQHGRLPVVCCDIRGPCDVVISRSEESHSACACVCVCV
jgi:hypothetical protein